MSTQTQVIANCRLVLHAGIQGLQCSPDSLEKGAFKGKKRILVSPLAATGGGFMQPSSFPQAKLAETSWLPVPRTELGNFP